MIGQGDIARARQLMTDAFPKLLEDQPELEVGDQSLQWELVVGDLNSALVFAAVLHANGERKQRDALLLAMEKRIATMHRVRGRGYGILDVYIHAIRGDHDKAIAALREAIDMGWRASLRVNWFTLRQDWLLGSLREDPEFVATVDELEADINAQRQWFEENKDKPLF